MNNYKSTNNAGMIVHDVDLRKWSLYVKNIIDFKDSQFKASDL